MGQRNVNAKVHRAGKVVLKMILEDWTQPHETSHEDVGEGKELIYIATILDLGKRCE
jgi:hypothetical protein